MKIVSQLQLHGFSDQQLIALADEGDLLHKELARRLEPYAYKRWLYDNDQDTAETPTVSKDTQIGFLTIGSTI